MPARSPPIANVVTITRSTSIPIRLAISLSSATARIDFPVLVLRDEQRQHRDRHDHGDEHDDLDPVDLDAEDRPRAVAATSGTPNPRLCAPKKPRAVFCRNSDAPIAVMSGTSRGAFRSGR